MVEACSKVIVLLGVKAEGPKVEYGWIEPGALIAGGWSNFRRLRRIQRFWEKPSQSVARELFARRCLWNSFVMIASVKALMNLFMRGTSAALHPIYWYQARVWHHFRTESGRGSLF